MLDQRVLFRTIAEHRDAFARGEYTSEALTEAMLAHIAENDADVGAFLTVDRAGALQAARASDARRRQQKTRSDLDGIPFGVKDNYCTRGLPTTCASKMLRNFIPPYDATVITRLRETGAVLLGKQNMDEFALGSSNEYSALQTTCNPHDPQRVAGGSSGGSAAAVAMGMGSFALGTDTGGSVRQPAAFCGVYGLKPTYGAISRYGVVEMASSMDCVGILSRSAADCEILFRHLAFADAADATSRSVPLAELPQGNLCIAVPDRLEQIRPESSVLTACQRAAACFSECGATVDPIALPDPEQALAAYRVLSAAECASNLARFDGIRYGQGHIQAQDLYSRYADARADGFGDEVKRRILFGTYVLQGTNRALFYEHAVATREKIRQSILRLLSRFHLMLLPTASTTAFTKKSVPTSERYRSDLCTVYANLAGVPALSVPFGTDENGMPVAVQLMAGVGCEPLLFHAARILEHAGAGCRIPKQKPREV